MTRPEPMTRLMGERRGTQAAITRALKAAQEAGIEIDRFEVDGPVVRVYARSEDAQEDERTEAEKWLAENGSD